MLTIGEFSRICFVSKKTLRHYDEIGLLRPQYTAENGYRYYETSQLREMRLISRLKDYGFSLLEVAAVLADPAQLGARLCEKRREMQAALEQTASLLARLDDDVAKLKRSIDIMDQSITVKTAQLPAQTIFSLRKNISVSEFPQKIAELFREAARKKLTIAGPPMVFYHSEEFNTDASDIEFALPVKENSGSGIRVFEGGLHCFATLAGPYVPDGFKATYAGLAKWIDDNGYHISGAPFDSYVRGGEGVDPTDYVTEIYFPISK